MTLRHINANASTSRTQIAVSSRRGGLCVLCRAVRITSAASELGSRECEGIGRAWRPPAAGEGKALCRSFNFRSDFICTSEEHSSPSGSIVDPPLANGWIDGAQSDASGLRVSNNVLSSPSVLPCPSGFGSGSRSRLVCLHAGQTHSLDLRVIRLGCGHVPN